MARTKARKRSDGRYAATLTIDGPTGRRRVFFYGPTVTEARAARDEAKRLAAQGVDVIGDKLTVAVYLRRWWAHARPAYRPRTAARWDELLGRIIDGWEVTFVDDDGARRVERVAGIGSIPLAKLTPAAVNAFLLRLAESGRKHPRPGQTGLAASTVVEVRAVLRKALHDAQREGLLLRNVAALATRPKVERGEPDSLTAEEASRFLAAAAGDRLEPLYVLLVYSGLRLGEALGLQWRDVDLAAGTVTVRKALARIGGEFVLVEPKSRRSLRTLDLHPAAVESLRSWSLEQLREQHAAGDEWRPLPELGRLVFTDPFGRPVLPWAPTIRFHSLCARAGLRSDRPLHVLRHTAATVMLANGVDLRTVSAMLGHSGIGVTAQFYAASQRQTRRDASQRLGDALAAAVEVQR